MGCDIHPAVEVRRKDIWRFHQPKTECPYYYDFKYERTSVKPGTPLRKEWVRDAEGNRVKSHWDHCKYALPEFFKSRDYAMFAVLADVRNDGDYIPISEPRGLPFDVTKQALARLSDEHSQTWLSLQDLTQYGRTETRDIRYDPATSSYVETHEISEAVRPAWLTQWIGYLTPLVPKGGTDEDVRVVMDFDS